MANKKFNAWISAQFKGLSAHTLYQLLCDGFDHLCLDHFNNMVYVDLFDYFCGDRSDRCTKAFTECKQVIADCNWL